MSYMDEYNKLKKKRKEEEKKTSGKTTNSGGSSYMNEYNKLKGQKDSVTPLSSVTGLPISLPKKDEKKKETKDTTDDSKLDFFQKGAFEDGFQAVDIPATILGTVGDAATNALKGMSHLAEGIVDLGHYGVIGVGNLFGASDEWVDKQKKIVIDSVTDEMFEPAENYFNEVSLLGRTSDSVMQGIGQVGGIIATGGLGELAGLGSLGVTALTSATMGLSGMGSGMGEAYEGGATDLEALKHGLNVGATDAISELIFGGMGKAINAVGFSKGLSSADDIVAKALSSKFKNQMTKNIVEFGVKSGAEGLEEVIAGVAQAYSKSSTYMSDEEFLDILKDENLLEQFVVGAVTSGIAQSPSLHTANKTKTDFITGRTQNEQKVVDKEVENRIAEKEKSGEKLTAREKSNIVAQVEKDLERGYIETDTIESVLGGETYEGYKSLTEQETSLKEEIEALENTPESQFTVKQRERLTELREQLKGIDTKTAKSNLFSEVDKLTANDTLLRESYNEKARRGQTFEADLTKYDAKQQETIKKAVESGILNNTNRTHEFVDLVAKISADKGVLFDFTNNQKLKESGFAIDGKQVNGYVTKDGITVNVNSAKSLDTVVGHEITHVLEGTDLYTELQTAIVEYAKSKNDYQGRYDALTKLYENIEGANIDSELTAELVGDYIFTDTDFIHNLSTNHRNVFKKIYDEVKYLYKVATAGSKEARELERVKKIFDEAWRADVKVQENTTENSGVKYKLSDLEIDRVNIDFKDATKANEAVDSKVSELVERGKVVPLSNESISKYKESTDWSKYKEVRQLLRDILSPNKGISVVFEYGDKGAVAYLTSKGVNHSVGGLASPKKAAAFEMFRSLVKNAEYVYSSKNDEHSNANKNIDGDILWDTFVAVGTINGEPYPVTFKIRSIDADVRSQIYEMATKNETGFSHEDGTQENPANAHSNYGTSPVSAENVAQKGEDVKPQYSLSDSNGNQLSNEQQEYFKDSKVRDENGNLKVVYHGTPNGDYSVFKEGTYFTDNKAYADRYQNPSASSISTGKATTSPKTFEVYLDIKKPFDLSDAEAKRIYIEEYIKGGNALGINPYLSDAEYEKISTIDWTEGEDLRDFLIENEYDYDGLVLDEGADGGYGEDVQYRGKSYVIFNPEQAKSVDNTNPTGNPDMNLSLSENDIAPTGKFLGKDIALETAPMAETEAEAVEADVAPVAEVKVEDYAPGESLEEQLAKADDSVESLDSETESLFRDYAVQNITDAEFEAKWKDLDKRFTQARQEQERLSAEMTDINNRKYESLDDSDIPPEAEAPYYGETESIAPVDPFAERDMNEVGKRNVKAYMYENPEVKPYFQDAARGMLYDLNNGTKGERIFNEQLHYESGYEKGWMGTSRRTTGDIADLLDQWGYTYDQIEAGLNAIIEDNGKENNAVSKRIEFMLDNRLRNGYKDVDGRPIPADDGYINLLKEKQIDDYRREAFDSFMEVADQYAPPAEDVAPVKTEPAIDGKQTAIDGVEQAEEKPERLTRGKLHSQIVAELKSEFAKKGYDLDEILSNAKRLNAVSINDNTPQRVNDKTFGYEAGEVLNDLTFNKVALNESDGTKWLNEQIDTIRNLSKKYKIKPLSKESAAAQMYAEGFWVNEKDEIIAYGDAELAQDFPNVQVQNRIKALASDPTIRKIYDDTLSAINASRARNAYPEIPRLENYYLHFRAMDDTFSKLGIPFNPNDIKAKDLPTDINGTTIDRKPGQPFFTSSFHREGKRTSFDMLGGIEKYLNSAKNQIYHIDDIQTARALWGYIADRYGQAHGLENLDYMEYEAQAEHIQKVYDGHLSNYARFLTEYANNLAGKTALIDRGVEGLIGRRALQFINTVNTQTSRNQVGYSVSSPLTNFIPSMETIARTPKQDSIKAFAQTISNVFRKDGFVENDPTLIRRKGTDKFAKTLWEKMSDPGYILMGAVDNVTSEFIVRTKYNELTRKGMDSKQAHIKAGEWAMRVMGDRSIGQMPLLYNSKFMGLFTKYQLEVRNALDSQFYDTFQEAKTSTKEVENQKAKNALTATKFAYRAVQIAALNHVFGMAFEKIAGYNPAFDIVSTIATLFGWDDDEEDEDTFGDNANQAFKELLGDLPYTSLITDGGRIPAGSALPIKQFVTGIDKYGNEKPRWETALEAAPYYLLPGGYGQIKKTTQGLGMFSDEHPVSGSYTDSGNLRFPVEKTFGNVVQAGVFGQYASENARDYFDNERSPLKEKQIQEYIDVDIPIQDYWDYREGLAKLKTNEDKVDYIDSLDLPLSKKNILVNNVLDRKEDVDLANYSDYGSLAEFDFAVKYPEKYQFFEEIGITYDEYKNSDDDSKDAYNWAYENPDKYTVAMAVSGDVVEYRSYTKGLSDIKADKDENGKSVNGSRKEKVFSYIDDLPLDYGQKCILFKSQYKSDDSMNMDIIEYLDSREDIDYEEMVTILTELGFTVNGNNVYWD